jgi:transcriptional regulator GlxA family with amidase domain
MAYLGPELVAAQLDLLDAPEITLPVIADAQLRDSLLLLLCRAAPPQPERLAVEEALTHAIARLTRRYGNRDFRGGHHQLPGLSRALARLRDEPEAQITLGELAEIEGVSRFQLLRAFVRQTGVTPHAYQMQLRVRLARRLLAAGRLPAAVAAETGFSDQSHLNRVFRRQVGTSPGRYRQAVGGLH